MLWMQVSIGMPSQVAKCCYVGVADADSKTPHSVPWPIRQNIVE